MKEKLNSLIGIGKKFGSGMSERNLGVYATSGCYYLFMSLVPVTMIICCILPYTPFNQNMVMNLIDQYFAKSLGDILRTIASAVYRSNAATLTISIVLTLFSASASMKAVMKGIDAAYKCKEKNNIIVFTVRALIYMVLLVIALIASLVVMVYGGKILILLKKHLGKVGILALLLSQGRYFLVFLVLFNIFLVFYTLMPADKVAVKNQIPGALFSAVIWVAFSWVFTIYVTISDKFGAYGFLGTVMVCMMWMYYCLFFLLIGGFMNSFLTEEKMLEAEPAIRGAATNPTVIEEAVSTATPAEEVATRDVPDEVSDGDMPDGEVSEGDVPDEEVSDGVVPDEAVPDGVVPDEELPEGVVPDEEASDENEKKSKKKLLIPIIAVAAACAIASIITVFFVIRRKKTITVPEVEIKK